MENNPKVKGKNNENSHSETMNHFEILVMKSQDKGATREKFSSSMRFLSNWLNIFF